MKMRFAWYAGASTALAATVVVSAFHQRANFYSAMVYLAESNLCLMILVNLVFLVYGSSMYGLQRLCFGQLRPIEIEQLYEKAWFAVTETCLAMTIFREEVGAFFLVMFTALVTGKVWGWIGDGRVEILEQQPPANPRLFHARLSVSLALSVVYDLWLLHYAVRTVIEQARPNMMVMFLFEFAVLAVCSIHTALRYILSLVEARIVKTQTRQRLEERRRQVREERLEILRQREAEDTANDENQEPPPHEDDVEEMDIEVPGWEEKGQWVLSLDLMSDFMKLSVYAAFFCVLLTFYGLPIHIMRDLFMTTRSFVKRLGALLKYRQALRDMDKYPDATDEELARENICIICREEMRPWIPAQPGQVERTRPKRLPCGHILHFGCLKSWLERQQVCPTCRRSVVIDDAGPGAAAAGRNRDAMVFRVGLNLAGGQNQPGQPGAPADGPGNAGQDGLGGQPQQQQPQQPQPRNGVRMFNLGPLRLGFAQGGVNDIQDMAQRLGVPQDVANGAAIPPTPQAQPPQPPQQPPATATATTHLPSSETLRAQLREIDQRVQHEIQSLQATHQELQTLHLLVQELGRIRQLAQLQQQLPVTTTAPQAIPQLPLGQQPLPAFNPQAIYPQHQQFGQNPQLHSFGVFAPFAHRAGSPSFVRHATAADTAAIPAGSPDLPEGVVIPQGWSLLPLQRLEHGGVPPVVQQAPLGVQVQVPLDVAAHQGPLSNLSLSPSEPAANTTTTTITTDDQASEAHPAVSVTGPQTETPQEGSPQESAQQSAPSDSVPGPSGSIQQHHGETNSSVAAPTPVMPNWGGSAQLFGGGGAFGYQPPTGQSASSTPVQPHHEEMLARQDAGQQPGGSSSSDGPPAGVPEGGPSAASDGGASSAAEEQANGGPSSGSKGKARAVTVEEAEDEEDE